MVGWVVIWTPPLTFPSPAQVAAISQNDYIPCPQSGYSAAPPSAWGGVCFPTLAMLALIS